MPAEDLRKTYLDLLMDNVRESRFPSGELLDRIEATIRTPEQVEEYVEVLFDKCQGGTAPSLNLLERIRVMVEDLEGYEALTQ
jgi:hypothetical protein